MTESAQLRSKMRVALGLGAAHHGVKHWWLQRLTALVLVPLSMWFVVWLLKAALFPMPEMVAEWLASPINAIAMTLFICAMFIHVCLGIQVIIEDYVKAPFGKYGLLMLNSCMCFLLAVISIFSILRLHMLDFTGAL